MDAGFLAGLENETLRPVVSRELPLVVRPVHIIK